MFTKKDESTPLNTDFSQVKRDGHFYAAIEDNQCASATGKSHDDEEACISGTDEESNQQVPEAVGSIIAVLLLGEFLSNADTTLVLAATGKISSELSSLQNADWVSTAYTLGVCTTLPIYTKLSNVFGRKPLLMVGYFFFALGCIICGLGPNMWVFILGRSVSGVGGAGIMAVGSIIIMDIVPRKDVAHWRARVNIAMTLGRSAGGPLGGWLIDLVGWRWSFLCQAPLIVFAMLLVLSKLKLTRPISATQESNFLTSLLGRIDFLGTTLLIGAISTTLLLIDQGGKLFPWVSCLSVVLLGSSILLLSIFCYAEVYVAKEPIFDLRVLRKENVLASYAVGALQSVAQAGVIFSIPLYFQVTARASTAEAGGHLVPAVLGNTVGALLVGFYTQRFKSYTGLLPFACIASLSTYLLLFFCWNGQTTPLESLFIIPAGLGFGITSTVVFATMVSFLNSEETATVTGGYILLQTFIASVSVTGTNTLLGFEFLKNLRLHIRSQEIVEQATSNLDYIAHLSGTLREIVVHCYVIALNRIYVICIVLSILSLLASFTVRASCI